MALSRNALLTGLLCCGCGLACAAGKPAAAPGVKLPDCWIEHSQLQEPPARQRLAADADGLAPGAFSPRRLLGAEHPRPEQMRPCRIQTVPKAPGISGPDYPALLSSPQRP